jgi:hypothetical protein
MESPDVEVLLSMVKDLDTELGRYLAGSTQACEAVPHILDACKQIRAKEIDGPMHYWVGAIEHHARQIGNPRQQSGDDGLPFAADECVLSIQLLQDIYYLRRQLMGGRSSIH